MSRAVLLQLAFLFVSALPAQSSPLSCANALTSGRFDLSTSTVTQWIDETKPFILGLQVPPTARIVLDPTLEPGGSSSSAIHLILPAAISTAHVSDLEAFVIHENGHRIFLFNIEKYFEALNGLREMIISDAKSGKLANQAVYDEVTSFSIDIQEVFADTCALVVKDDLSVMSNALENVTAKNQQYRSFDSAIALSGSRPADFHDKFYDVRIEIGALWKKARLTENGRASFLSRVLEAIGSVLQAKATGNKELSDSEMALAYIQALRKNLQQ